MAIAITLQQYLSDRNIDYDVMVHERTSTSSQTAEASHVPGHCLAKGVVLTREGGYLIAVVPASRKVQLDAVRRIVHSPVAMATESEIGALFPDCDAGAVPVFGAAYGIEAIVDDSLGTPADIYLEGGDHRSVIHISGPHFRELVQNMPHGQIAENI